MSGGSLNYFYSYLEDHIGDFDDKELDDLVKDLAKLFHDREWYLSSDTGVGSWRESRDEFKDKWFTQHGRQERIEKYLEEIRTEVLDSFGLNDKKCSTCKHWTLEKSSQKYGLCELNKGCLWNRSEICNKWEGDAK